MTGPLVLSGIRVHPLKGAGGVSLDRVGVDVLGPRPDRRWMLVDPDGAFLSQRDAPALARLRVERADGGFRVRAPGGGSLPLEEGPGDPERIPVRIWETRVEAARVGERWDAWFSRVLGRPCRLVHMSADVVRPTDDRYAPGGRVSFSDGFPFLLAGAASLDELNRRLEHPVPMDRFRPNLVVAGADPFAEDRWRRIRIGEVELDVVKPCPRCAVTTRDQATGEAAGKEPLRTLAAFRRHDGKAYFGQNAVHRGEGWLVRGEAVEILATGDPRPPLDRDWRVGPGGTLAETFAPSDE